MCAAVVTLNVTRAANAASVFVPHVWKNDWARLSLKRVGPAALVAARQAAEQIAASRTQERQLIMDRIRAHEELEARASREYKRTDATYVTVRRKLAAEWEEALHALQRHRDELGRFDAQCPHLPTAEQERELSTLGQNVRAIWHHPRASMILKKQIARTLIEEIIANLEKPRNEIVLTIHWKGGHHTVLRQPTHWKRQSGSGTDLKRIVGTL